MMKNLFYKQKDIIAIIVACLTGLIIFLLIYSELLNPGYDAWLLTGGPDLVQHYVGWLMYRQADWSFPIGLANNYAYPFSVAVTYTDSIPLLAIFFKLFRAVIPATFQYTGLWIMLCFILQSVFAYLILKIFISKRILSLLGSIFFTLSPIALFRLGGHFALGGHFLILVGIFLILKEHKKIAYRNWTILLIISVLVHPYLLFMNIFLLLADICSLLFVYKTLSLKKALLFLLTQTVILLTVAYALGLFTIKETSANGYGDFSMNLNALINPLTWSRLMPDLAIINYQTEGFNYLGLGIIFLLLLSIYKFLRKKQLKHFGKSFWPIIALSIILFFIAISNVVAINNNILWVIPWPESIMNNVFGFFRSSGRFFWPLYYLLFVVAFYIIKELKFKFALLLLIFALGLQIYDLSIKLNNRGHEFEAKQWDNTFISDGLGVGGNNYQHIVFLPVIPHRNFPAFAVYAASHSLTINDGYFARPINDLDRYREETIFQLESGILDKDTIYVFSREADELTANINLEGHLLKEVDNTIVLFPYYKK